MTDEEPRCGVDCACCEYVDGTAPCDHTLECVRHMSSRDGLCICDGTDERAATRKAVTE